MTTHQSIDDQKRYRLGPFTIMGAVGEAIMKIQAEIKNKQ